MISEFFADTVEDLGLGGVATKALITGAGSLDLSGDFLYALDMGNTDGPKTVGGVTCLTARRRRS